MAYDGGFHQTDLLRHHRDPLANPRHVKWGGSPLAKDRPTVGGAAG